MSLVGFIVVVLSGSSNTTLPLTTLNTVVLPLTVVILWVLFWKLILLWLLFSITLFESELFESVLVTLCELLFEFVSILLLLTLLSDKSEERGKACGWFAKSELVVKWIECRFEVQCLAKHRAVWATETVLH